MAMVLDELATHTPEAYSLPPWKCIKFVHIQFEIQKWKRRVVFFNLRNSSKH